VSSLIVVVGLVCGGMTIYVGAMAALMRRRTRCPACDHPTLSMRSLQRGVVWPPKGRPVDQSFYKCDACNAEFGREGKGPLVPKHAWDAGQRGEIPKATVVPPRGKGDRT
jgi:hypothetical protein